MSTEKALLPEAVREQADRLNDIRRRWQAVLEAHRNNEVDVLNPDHHAQWEDVRFLLTALATAEAAAQQAPSGQGLLTERVCVKCQQPYATYSVSSAMTCGYCRGKSSAEAAAQQERARLPPNVSIVRRERGGVQIEGHTMTSDWEIEIDEDGNLVPPTPEDR